MSDSVYYSLLVLCSVIGTAYAMLSSKETKLQKRTKELEEKLQELKENLQELKDDVETNYLEFDRFQVDMESRVSYLEGDR